MWRQRLMSPNLPNGGFGQYLLDQYKKIESECSTTLPVTTYASTLLVSTSTNPQATTTSTPSPATTCFGQPVEPAGLTCGEIADRYNVSTGSAIHATRSQACIFDQSICLPPPCDIDMVYRNPTCEELVAQYSTPDDEISLTQFLTWNPNILGSCGFLSVQKVCTR
ncbi:hypothetical protein BDV12DRAFT_89694 [Aspergillus spectabilis]